MFQQFATYLHTAATVLGYVSGIMTCVGGIVAVFNASDSKLGHAVAAIGIDVAKLRKAVAVADGEKP